MRDLMLYSIISKDDELVEKVTLLEEFTGWTFAMDTRPTRGGELMALGVFDNTPAPTVPPPVFLYLDPPSAAESRIIYLIESIYELDDPGPVISKVGEWTELILGNLGETEKSMRMKLELRLGDISNILDEVPTKNFIDPVNMYP